MKRQPFWAVAYRWRGEDYCVHIRAKTGDAAIAKIRVLTKVGDHVKVTATKVENRK